MGVGLDGERLTAIILELLHWCQAPKHVESFMFSRLGDGPDIITVSGFINHILMESEDQNSRYLAYRCIMVGGCKHPAMLGEIATEILSDGYTSGEDRQADIADLCWQCLLRGGAECYNRGRPMLKSLYDPIDGRIDTRHLNAAMILAEDDNSCLAVSQRAEVTWALALSCATNSDNQDILKRCFSRLARLKEGRSILAAAVELSLKHLLDDDEFPTILEDIFRGAMVSCDLRDTAQVLSHALLLVEPL